MAANLNLQVTSRIIRALLFCVFLSVFFCSALLAQQSIAKPTADGIITESTPKSRPRPWRRNHWFEYSNKSDDWYRSKEGIRTANNVLSWQSTQGSWPKNTNTTAKPFTEDINTIKGTFDNGATTNEIRFLSRTFRATSDQRYQRAILKGINHILKAQYPTGGWPQFYPPDKKYHRHITFNDGCMVRLMMLLRDVATSTDFDFIDAYRRKAAQRSFNRGIRCILKCQILVNGKLTAWCAQHDELDYSPRPGRTYELASLSGAESVGILQLLMTLEKPSPKVVRAVKAAAEWFEASKITGIRVVRTNRDRTVVKDPNAPPIWARFYEIETNRPIFAGRDGIIKYSLAEIEWERRAGYAWYSYGGRLIAEDYPKWKQKHAPSPPEPKSRDPNSK